MEHEICQADLAAFLTELGIALKKEGSALQAIARQWFEGSHEYYVIKSFGIQVDVYGQQILAVREHLCQKCLMTEIITGISIGKSSDQDKEVPANNSGEKKKS